MALSSVQNPRLTAGLELYFYAQCFGPVIPDTSTGKDLNYA
jgi:hypothetical protein